MICPGTTDHLEWKYIQEFYVFRILRRLYVYIFRSKIGLNLMSVIYMSSVKELHMGTLLHLSHSWNSAPCRQARQIPHGDILLIT
jgi:hypothetical protein